jgi:proteasome accessory factor C
MTRVTRTTRTSRRTTAAPKKAAKTGKKAASKKAASKKAASKKAAPKKAASKNAAPKKSAPKKSAPKKSAPKKSLEKTSMSVPMGRRSRRGPRSAAERVSGLLVMLPWLMKRQKVRLADMARQFRISEQDLVADLQMAAVCGVPPYTPDALIDVFIHEGWVIAEVPVVFSRPLKLSSAELFAIVATVRAAHRMPGAPQRSALLSATRKIEKLLPGDTDVPVAIDIGDAPFVSELRDAIGSRAELRITYFSPSRGERSQRTIRPLRLFAVSGRWYVAAFDDKSGEERTFRTDRVEALAPTGRVFERSGSSRSAEDPWFGSETPRVTLLVRPPAAWIAESYPTVSRRTRRDGALEVVLPVSSEHWLRRLLLRAGRHVEVIEPTELRGLGAATARDVLRRYRAV